MEVKRTPKYRKYQKDGRHTQVKDGKNSSYYSDREKMHSKIK